MFNGSTSFIPTTYRVFGDLDITRTFTLRDGLEQEMEARRNRGRSVMAMAELAVRTAVV